MTCDRGGGGGGGPLAGASFSTGEEGGGGGGERPSCWGVIFKIVIGFGELCSDKGSLQGNFFQLVQKQ